MILVSEMNGNTALTQRLTQCLGILVVSGVGAIVVNAAPAQPLPAIPQSQPVAQSASTIQGNWRLVSIVESPTPTPMVLPTTPELTADFAGDRVSGSGGCNRFNGGYKTTRKQLSIGPLASTFKACEEPIMRQEMTYLKALQGAQRYEVNGDGLQIFYQTEQGSGVLRFVSLNVRALW